VVADFLHREIRHMGYRDAPLGRRVQVDGAGPDAIADDDLTVFHGADGGTVERAVAHQHGVGRPDGGKQQFRIAVAGPFHQNRAQWFQDAPFRRIAAEPGLDHHDHRGR
jgi:hypothetical protein